jgi:hypothetical protein
MRMMMIMMAAIMPPFGPETLFVVVSSRLDEDEADV